MSFWSVSVPQRRVFTCLPLSLQTVCGYHSVQTGEKELFCFFVFLTINKLIPFLSGQPTLQVSGRLELQWGEAQGDYSRLLHHSQVLELIHLPRENVWIKSAIIMSTNEEHFSHLVASVI